MPTQPKLPKANNYDLKQEQGIEDTMRLSRTEIRWVNDIMGHRISVVSFLTIQQAKGALASNDNILICIPIFFFNHIYNLWLGLGAQHDDGHGDMLWLPSIGIC